MTTYAFARTEPLAEHDTEVEQARDKGQAGEDEHRATADGCRASAGEPGPDHDGAGAEGDHGSEHLESAGRSVAAACCDPGSGDEVTDEQPGDRRSRLRRSER